MPQSKQKLVSATEQRHVVHFEDHGQDALRWTIENGIVVESAGQEWIWKGTKVLSVPMIGKQVKILPKEEGSVPCFFRYKVMKIEATSPLPKTNGKSLMSAGFLGDKNVRRHPRGAACNRYRE